MDVQAASATATATATLLSTTSYGTSSQGAANSAPAVAAAAVAAAPVAAPAVAAPSSSANAGSNSSGNPAIGANPGLATLPAGPPDGAKKGSSDAPLTSGVAQLFNAQENNVSVSFQVTQDPNEIVTVFTDKQTGKVIVQFPSETMIALAKFFDKIDDAAVVNKKV